jgi:hypothetical protein
VTRQPTGQGMWDKADYVELTEARVWSRMKLRQFHEDIRPPYYGTYSKRSATVTGRRPFGRVRHRHNDGKKL